MTSRTTLGIALVVLLLGAGCAKYAWFKTGATDHQLATDRDFCTRKSQNWVIAVAGTHDAGISLLGVLLSNNAANRCMEELGWSDSKKNTGTELSDTPSVAANAYRPGDTSEVEELFAVVATQIESILPTAPFCDVSVYAANDLTTLRVSAHAHRFGFRVGDQTIAIDGSPVYTPDDAMRELFARMPGDTVTFTIKRNHVRSDITGTCADGLPIAEQMLAALNAGAKGRWSECSVHAFRSEQLSVASSVTAELRLLCSEGNRISHNRSPSAGDAFVAYDATRMALEVGAIQEGGVE